jgi:hypothetical protein
MAEKTKKCPFCGEEILEVAIKCKHCGTMLDGSDQEKRVTITGVDPFAELHAPIKGKAKGKLTFIGKVGVALGILFMLFGIISMGTMGEDIELQNSFFIVLLGVGFAVASYLWVRRPRSKK